MLKKRVLLWTRGQTWVVVGFLTLVWYLAYKLIMVFDGDATWLSRINGVIFLALPVVIARILFIAYGVPRVPRIGSGAK